jgi:hypothetical protein
MRIYLTLQRREEMLPNASASPAIEPAGHTLPGSIALR